MKDQLLVRSYVMSFLYFHSNSRLSMREVDPNRLLARDIQKHIRLLNGEARRGCLCRERFRKAFESKDESFFVFKERDEARNAKIEELKKLGN